MGAGLDRIVKYFILNRFFVSYFRLNTVPWQYNIHMFKSPDIPQSCAQCYTDKTLPTNADQIIPTDTVQAGASLARYFKVCFLYHIQHEMWQWKCSKITLWFANYEKTTVYMYETEWKLICRWNIKFGVQKFFFLKRMGRKKKDFMHFSFLKFAVVKDHENLWIYVDVRYEVRFISWIWYSKLK